MVARGEYAGASKMSTRLGAIFTIIATPIVLLIAITSQWWLAFFGPEFAEEWHVFTLFLIIAAFGVAFISIHPLFTAMGYVKQNFVILGVANGIYVVLALALGSMLGLLGIILAYGVKSHSFFCLNTSSFAVVSSTRNGGASVDYADSHRQQTRPGCHRRQRNTQRYRRAGVAANAAMMSFTQY